MATTERKRKPKSTTKTSATGAENKPINTPVNDGSNNPHADSNQAFSEPFIPVSLGDLPSLSIPVLAEILWTIVSASGDASVVTIDKAVIMPVVDAIYQKGMTSSCHYSNCALWRKAQLEYYAKGVVNRLLLGASKPESPVTTDEAKLLSDMLKNDYTNEILSAFFGGNKWSANDAEAKP